MPHMNPESVQYLSLNKCLQLTKILELIFNNNSCK